MADIEFRGQYDQDLLRRAVAQGDPRSRTAKIFSFVLMGLFLFNAGWAVRDYLAGRLVTFVEVAGLVLPMAIIGYLIYHTYQMPARIAAELWRGPASRVPLAGRATPDGLVIDSPRIESGAERLIPWDQIVRIQKSEDLLVMTTVDKVLIILPRRFFDSEEAWIGFLELVPGD